MVLTYLNTPQLGHNNPRCYRFGQRGKILWDGRFIRGYAWGLLLFTIHSEFPFLDYQ